MADRISYRALWCVFLYALWWRFQWVFGHSPLDYLFSDPGRHYENGQRLFNPTITGSMDPFLYQLYVWLLLTVSNNQPWLITMLTGLLSAAMPLCWYLFLREMLPKSWAVFGALLIAVTPSLTFIYGYFMNETLLLNLLGLAFWLTWRSLRVKTWQSFALAALLWALASITRLVALPMAALCLAFLIGKQRAYAKQIPMTLLIFALVGVWPALHTHKRLNVYNPLGFSTMNTIYARSGAKAFRFTTENPAAVYEFSAPSFYGPPHLAPLSEWRSPRDGVFTFHVDLAKGMEDWKNVLKELEEKPYGVLNQIRDNAVTLFFHGGWPDSSERREYNVYLYINWLSRWMWAPLTALIIPLLYCGYRTGPPREACLFALLMLTMLGALCVQQTGVMEGRFRKPIEPMILVSVVALTHRLWTSRRDGDRKNP